MTSPRHHFPDEVLSEYVAGACVEAVSLVIACHASLCAPCRRRLTWLEQVAGSLIESAGPTDMRPDALDRALAGLSEAPISESQPLSEARVRGGVSGGRPSPRALRGLEFLARPLWPYLESLGVRGRDSFKQVVRGIGVIELAIAPRGGTARLVELEPGITVPLHDHGGPEYGVLFAGGLREEDGREWHRGDVFHRLPGESHVQAVLPGEACIALVINEGSLIPLTPAGDVLKLFSA
jgi:putative transcriptional regulator